MTLNHINLSVTDVAETASFFEKYFNFKIHKAKANTIAILEDEEGFVLVLSNFPNTATFNYPVDFHIGFYQENKENVLEIFSKLQSDGFALTRQPNLIRDRFGFYFYAPGGILIEITCAEE